MNYNKEALFTVWYQAIIKSLMQPAQRMLDGQPKQRGQGDGTTALIKIIPLVIIALSLASVTNMASRAYSHHASNSSYAIGFGLAVMVPVIVFTALRLQNGWASGLAWFFAIVFAFASGSIQFQIYNAGQPITFDTLFSVGVNLEALAFGFGVPFAECVLAGLEGLLIWQIETKERRDAAQAKTAEVERNQQDEAKAKAEAVEVERKERERQEWQAEQERKRQEWQAEQDRIAAEHAQKLELQRLKVVNKTVNGTVNKPHKTADSTPVDTVNSGEIDARKLLEFYRENPASSLRKTGAAFGVSHTQISKVLKRLEGEGLVSVNGVVKVL